MVCNPREPVVAFDIYAIVVAQLLLLLLLMTSLRLLTLQQLHVDRAGQSHANK